MKKYLPICIIVLLSVVCLSIYGKEDKKEEFKTNIIKENENRFTIAAYINGVYSDTMPAESKYFGYVECRDNSGNKLDTLGFVEWENDKWNVRITDITKASTCNVYFIDPPAHWLDAEEGTLLKAIKDNNKVENVRSIPGKQINKEDEAILSGTLDDYGTSYYFRGNVKNNYVVFANKCWKIVRITGDGSIKLFLWNNNGTDCNVKNFLSSRFNDSNNKVSYVGFMYGNPDAGIAFSDNNTGAQDNINDSTILTNLKLWYDTTFDTANTTDYINLLADTIWCGDKSFYDGRGFGSGPVSLTYFSARARIVDRTLANPSLVCLAAGTDGKASKYTAQDIINGNGKLRGVNGLGEETYKIGMLTADEVSYAGGAYNVANNVYYLYTGQNYWTMTPMSYGGSRAFVGRVDSTGFLRGDEPVEKLYNMCPSIALNYNVQAFYDKTSSYEPGTVNNPYIVD